MCEMFDAHDEIQFHALIFAESSWDAIQIAELHRDSAFGLGHTPMSVVPRFMPLAGAARDHLQAALDRNERGIGHLQPDGSWLIVPAGKRPRDANTPPRMRMFDFADDDGDEYVIFALDMDRAVEIFTAYLDDPNALPHGWIPLTWEHWTRLGLVRHQRQAEARGVEGIGRYSAAGWVILPIDYKRLGLTAP
jgi:hypothetical protein